MGNFRDNKRSGGGNRGGGGRGGFGGGGRGGGRGGFGGGRSEMHHATCSDCGRDCEVPFKPTRGKDVFCNNCFKKDGGSDFGRSDDRRGGGRDFGGPKMHKATCADCGNRCEVPFRPTGDKPVYCSDCFGGGGSNDRRGGDRGGKDSSKKAGPSQEDFDALNKKLDKILKILEIAHPKKSFTVSKSDIDMAYNEEEEDVKPAKEKAPAKAPAKKKSASKKAPAKKKVVAKKTAKKASKKKVAAKKKATKKK